MIDTPFQKEIIQQLAGFPKLTRLELSEFDYMDQENPRELDKEVLRFIVSNDKFNIIETEIYLNEDYFEEFREGLRARKTRLVYPNPNTHRINLK